MATWLQMPEMILALLFESEVGAYFEEVARVCTAYISTYSVHIQYSILSALDGDKLQHSNI